MSTYSHTKTTNGETLEQVEVVHNLLIEEIMPDPDQPRKYFDEEADQQLADSIDRYGLVQPIMVRPIIHHKYKYIIVHGERRFRANKVLDKKTINAIIKEMDDSEARDLQLLENVQRKDLSDIELAWEFNRRVNLGQTHEQIADLIGCKRAYVTQRLSLLRLSKDDQERMLHGKLGFSQARALLSIRDPSLREQISGNISHETTVKEIKRIIQKETKKPDKNVTRVTPQGVLVAGLYVNKVLHDENGELYELVPIDKLLRAYIEDLKQLREVPL